MDELEQLALGQKMGTEPSPPQSVNGVWHEQCQEQSSSQRKMRSSDVPWPTPWMVVEFFRPEQGVCSQPSQLLISGTERHELNTGSVCNFVLVGTSERFPTCVVNHHFHLKSAWGVGEAFPTCSAV